MPQPSDLRQPHSVALALVLTSLAACGPTKSSATDTIDSSSTLHSSTGSGTTGSPTGPATSTTQLSDTSTSPGPMESTAMPTTGPGSGPCDTFDDQCPPGYKCMPNKRFGELECFEVVADPALPGEPCTSLYEMDGPDSCVRGSVCWKLVCLQFCDGIPEAPVCPPHAVCKSGFYGIVNICVPACDPLSPDCAEGEGCFRDIDSFGCMERGDSRMVFEPCADQQVCAAGLACWGKSIECGGDNGSCCHQLCDINLPNKCAGVGQSCQPLFTNPSLPEYEKLGICTTE